MKRFRRIQINGCLTVWVLLSKTQEVVEEMNKRLVNWKNLSLVKIGTIMQIASTKMTQNKIEKWDSTPLTYKVYW